MNKYKRSTFDALLLHQNIIPIHERGFVPEHPHSVVEALLIEQQLSEVSILQLTLLHRVLEAQNHLQTDGGQLLIQILLRIIINHIMFLFRKKKRTITFGECI